MIGCAKFLFMPKISSKCPSVLKTLKIGNCFRSFTQTGHLRTIYQRDHSTKTCWADPFWAHLTSKWSQRSGFWKRILHRLFGSSHRKQFSRFICPNKTFLCISVILLRPQSWSSLSEGVEGSYLPNCQTNFVIALCTLFPMFCKFINATA